MDKVLFLQADLFHYILIWLYFQWFLSLLYTSRPATFTTSFKN